MRAASATPFRESFDFTPKGNRAERVQTVNGPSEPGFSACALFQCFGALDHVVNVYAATETGRSVSASAGRTTSWASVEPPGSGSSYRQRIMAARKISSAIRPNA